MHSDISERNGPYQVIGAMSTPDHDWQSDMMDDEGNYYQNESNYALPGTVRRGSAPQRLNMRHGFMKHIVSVAQSILRALPACQRTDSDSTVGMQEQNQNARQQYEAQNPSSSMQQRYLAEPQS